MDWNDDPILLHIYCALIKLTSLLIFLLQSDYSDSDNDHVMNHSTYLNSCSTPTSFQHTSDANNSSFLHINFDHCYWMTSSNGIEQVMTPKRRKVLSNYPQFL